MRITLQRKTGKWTLSGMDEFHLALLRKVSSDVSYSQSTEGRARLFPPPLGGEETFMEEEFLDDWKEFVVHDMEDKFSADVRTLLSDLEQLKPQQRKGEVETAPLQRLTLPLENAPAWFSALNQARLMLELRHKFHDEHDQFVSDPKDSALTEEAQRERFVAYLRYEFFCMIQEWIVRHAL